MNKRILPTVAASAAGFLLLAGCSGTQDDTAAPAADDAPTVPAASESAPEEAWPAVEDEDGNVVLDEGESGTEASTWTVELDGESYTVDPMAEGPFTAGATFSIEESGVPTIATVGSEAPDGVEEYREAAGVPEHGYIRVDIDNREGTELVNMTGFEIFDADGQSYEYETLWFLLSDWKPVMTDYESETIVNYNGEKISAEEDDRISDMEWDLNETYGDTHIQPGEMGTVWFAGEPVPEQFTKTSASESMMYVSPVPAQQTS